MFDGGLLEAQEAHLGLKANAKLALHLILHVRDDGTDVGGVAYLHPQGSATRAQIATLMRNYALNILG